MNAIIILVLGLIIIWMLLWIGNRPKLKKPSPPLEEGRLFWQHYIHGSQGRRFQERRKNRKL